MFMNESNKTHTHNKGEFFCTTCQGIRPYVYKQERGYFNVFNVPLLPLNCRAEYIECQVCGDSFKPAVLQQQSQSPTYVPEYYVAVVGTLLKMVGNASNPHTMLFIQRTFKKLTGQKLSQSQLDTIAQQIQAQDFMSYMQQVGYHLNEKGRAKVLAAAFFSMESNGQLNDPEQVLLNSINNSLNLPPDYVHQLTQRMTQLDTLHKDVA